LYWKDIEEAEMGEVGAVRWFAPLAMGKPHPPARAMTVAVEVAAAAARRFVREIGITRGCYGMSWVCFEGWGEGWYIGCLWGGLAG
jgi:hypothetical protein